MKPLAKKAVKSTETPREVMRRRLRKRQRDLETEKKVNEINKLMKELPDIVSGVHGLSTLAHGLSISDNHERKMEKLADEINTLMMR